ncbi:MAG: anti-sigma factor [Pseudomonadota bacterium]
MPGTLEMARDENVEAMEYVLAVMDPQERRAFELALLDDPDLAAQVWQTEEVFAPLHEVLVDRKPPARVKRGIEEKVFGPAPAAQKSAGRFAVAFWRGLASLFGVAAVGAGALVAVLLVRPGVVYEQPVPFVAAIIASDGAVTLARVADDGALVAEPFTLALGDGRDPELWAIYEGVEPISLGLLSATDRAVISLQKIMERGLSGVQLVVTDEPLGGAPQGIPTGPAVGQGPLRQI